MPELWRSVVGNDRYEVSSYGNVRNAKSLRVLKPWPVGYGYLTIGLGKAGRHYVHQLICTTWHGPRPDGLFACHANDIKTDNRPQNLYWGTRSENMDDMIRNDRTRKGEKHHDSKLTEELVREMRALRADTKMSYPSIAAKYNVSTVTAWDAINRRTWTHVR